MYLHGSHNKNYVYMWSVSFCLTTSLSVSMALSYHSFASSGLPDYIMRAGCVPMDGRAEEVFSCTRVGQRDNGSHPPASSLNNKATWRWVVGWWCSTTWRGENTLSIEIPPFEPAFEWDRAGEREIMYLFLLPNKRKDFLYRNTHDLPSLASCILCLSRRRRKGRKKIREWWWNFIIGGCRLCVLLNNLHNHLIPAGEGVWGKRFSGKHAGYPTNSHKDQLGRRSSSSLHMLRRG